MNLFLDSMMYLNPVPVEEIDFRAFFHSKSITVRVPRVTLTILEELKNSHAPNVRSRSARALFFLEKALASCVAGRPGIGWLFSPTMSFSEMAQYELDSACNEDCFIAAALRCKSSHRSQRTVVMTDDIDAQLDCSHLKIETAHLPFQFRNPRFAASDIRTVVARPPNG
jgi:hypothetical protein